MVLGIKYERCMAAIGAALLCLANARLAHADVTWRQDGPALREPEPATSNQFGVSACIAGDTVFVGKHSGPPSVYPFQLTAGVWQRGNALQAPAQAEGWESSCAMTETTAVFGGKQHAFVYMKDSGIWSAQGAPLEVPSQQASLGLPVAISGDTVIVGRSFRKAADTQPDSNPIRQAAFVYARNGGTWTMQGPALSTPLADDDVLGAAVAMSGDAVAVASLGEGPSGKAGAVSLFVRDSGSWAPQGPPLQDLSLHFPYQFGSSVALSGETLAVASFHYEPGARRFAAVYLFERTGTAWAQQGPPLLVPATPHYAFKNTIKVALYGHTLALATPGVATVFTRKQGVWAQTAELTPSEDIPVNGAWSFAHTVGLSEHALVVGARYAAFEKTASSPSLRAAGSAYVFTDGYQEGEAGAGGEAGAAGSAGAADAGATEAGAAGAGAAEAGAGGGWSSLAGGVANSAGGRASAPGQGGGVPDPSPANDERSSACGCRVGTERDASPLAALAGLLLACCGMLRRRMHH